MALTAAVLIKPLAIVAIPAVIFLLWREGRGIRAAALPIVAMLGVAPSLLVPIPQADVGVVSRLLGSAGASWGYFTRSPEIMLAFAVPLAAYLVFKRSGASRAEWTWLGASALLMATFVVFFAFNGVATAGLFFIPRYATLVVPFAVVLLFLMFDRAPIRAQFVGVTAVVVLCAVGVRGPLAWGASSPYHPFWERSLVYVDRLEEQQAGLARLAEVSLELPVFYDLFTHFELEYPELQHFAGVVHNGMSPFLEDDWGADLELLPDKFAMLVGFPGVGGEDMRYVQAKAEGDPRYELSRETFGTVVSYPLELIIVERVSG